MTSSVLFRLEMEVVIKNTGPERSSSYLLAVQGRVKLMVRELLPVLVQTLLERKYSFGWSQPHRRDLSSLTTLLFLSDIAHACQGLLSYNLYRTSTTTEEKY
jgi:hypothetical protein